MRRTLDPVDVRFSDADAAQAARMVEDVLRSGRLTQGPRTRDLEDRAAGLTGRRHAIAVASGTAALEAMLRAAIAAGLLPEHGELLVPTNTFVATAVAALRAGVSVRLVDTGPGRLDATCDTFAAAAGSRSSAVCAVHIGGGAAPDAADLADWCASRGLLLFEDAAHAMGVTIAGRPAGSLGLAAAVSLFPTKVATSGEGGLILTDDERLADAARALRDHGKAEAGRNLHQVQGYNWRMSEVQAVVGLVSIRGLSGRLERRRALGRRLAGMIEHHGLPLQPLPVPDSVTPNGYKFPCLLPPDVDRTILKARLAQRGIVCGGEIYEVPLHKQPALRGIPGTDGSFPNAEEICRRHICLPLHESLSEGDLERIVAGLTQAVRP